MPVAGVFRSLFAIFLVAILLPAGVARAAQGALQFTDDRGVQVTFSSPPKRIVSVLPSLTETVCALGACERLVGVDRYSNWPASVKALPKVGGGLDPSLEAIVRLRPDVVLLATSSRAAERLEALGLKVLALEPKTHADVQRVLGLLGQLLQVKEPERAWREIDAGLTEIAKTLPAKAKGVQVYFEVDGAPYAAGRASFIGQTLARLGIGNIVPAELGVFPKLNPEFVVRANPGVIMVAQSSARDLVQRPGWSGMPAVQQGRVCVFAPAEFEMLGRPGPRMLEAARLMAQCVKDKSP